MIGNVETVYIVEDDPDARESVGALAGSMGLCVVAFGSAEEFLQQFDSSWHGCIIVDLRLPGISGLDLQQRLATDGSCLAVVLISAHASIPMAVQAMQNGAVTFIEKPYQNDELENAIRAAIDASREIRVERHRSEDFRSRLEKLTTREQIVMRDVLADKPNRAIARGLSVSLRTAARLRAAVFEKLGVMSATDLARLVAEEESAAFPLVHHQGYHKSRSGSA